MSDQASILVAAACGGDETSAAQLIELYYERIYAFLRRLTANDSFTTLPTPSRPPV